ncbi:ATP-binding protein [Candidatus Pacearchaeota archaeon]|jgi:hypothetical protein|nr:ATP-binding protein [Candidatus Pacearchaeota archaeon]
MINIFKDVLKIFKFWIVNAFDESAGEDFNNVVQETLLSPLVPCGFFLDKTRINNTIEFLKNRKLYVKSIWLNFNFGAFSRYMTECEFLEILNKNLSGNKNIKNLKIVCNVDPLATDLCDKFENKCLCTFTLKNKFVKLFYDDNYILTSIFYNSLIPLKTRKYQIFFNKIVEKIYMDMKTKIYNKLKLDDLKSKKFEPILKKIENFSDIYKDRPYLRWVILVHGEPGTGKSWIFENISLFLSNRFIAKDNSINTEMKPLMLKNYNNGEDNRQQNKNTRSNKKISEFNDIDSVQGPLKSNYLKKYLKIQIVDEFDKYVGNYIEDDTINQEKSYTVSEFKRILDNENGLIILITNHKDKIDPSVIRDGRVNEVIEINGQFYSPEEKEKIFGYYKKEYELPDDFKLSKSQLKNINIASIESTCKNKMLEIGYREFDKKIYDK